jgi:hypothetical protein
MVLGGALGRVIMAETNSPRGVTQSVDRASLEIMS